MTDEDLPHTRRDVTTSVTVELAAAGFEDAVEIGRGGFGVVYRCWQVGLDRTVAVKVLTAELDDDNRARFLREQRAMGRLTGHPNIVAVLEAGSTASGRPYLVMPYHPLNSLDTWIRTHGPLAVENVLAIGVRIAGALESVHRLGIVHRDVKPGNILLTDYGEPTLTDFGIAHIAGGFRTAAGTLTGSPAYTAPEVLEGETPVPAADVYGLGATLFCALTGHAAFERRDGENMVTQFLRITAQPVPNLRENGIPGDVSALVETAMDRDPRQRPSAADFGEAIRQVQHRHGFRADGMALRLEPVLERAGEKPSVSTASQLRAAGPRSDSDGNLPLDMTNFIGRRTEVSEVKNLLSAFRLVTLTGIGGVGKTRLALRAASSVRKDFGDGVWLVELADVSDASLLIDVVAAAVGIRDELATPLLETLVRFLNSRDVLLLLDNCEQIIDPVAQLTETLLQACPGLRILATSRERMNIAGEAALPVAPLAVPDPDSETSLLALPRFDAVTLFTDRAAAVVPGLELDDDNKAAVARICYRLDGLPLAIELAAALVRTMSPQQILQRLDDRYRLLTSGARTAATRQRTLRWSIDWSFELCSAAEQQLWARLSAFAASFELDAAEQICGTDLTGGSEFDDGGPDPLDVLSSLVDKSIVAREESGGVIRFRMLETLRDYGREKLRESGEDIDLRRRHRDWYERLALAAEAGWITDQQPNWIARLEREQPNLREAIEFCLSEGTEEAAEVGLRTVVAQLEFWSFLGRFGEGRFWLDRLFARPGARSAPDRVKALEVGAQLAALQGDFESATALAKEARTFTAQARDSTVQARAAYVDGVLTLLGGELDRASFCFERVVEMLRSDGAEHLRIRALTMLAWAYEVCDDSVRALERYREVHSIAQACGESLYRSTALRGMAVSWWRQGQRDRAQALLEEALRIDRRLKSPVMTAFSLEAMAWTVGGTADAEYVAVLLGAAEGLWPADGSVATVFSNMSRFHDECERGTRRALGDRRFDSARRRGLTMGIDAAVAYALGEQSTDAGRAGASSKLTKRERQVADLVARGLSNKQIASKLVISQRTAQGHVEHILSKLGFTSRAQIAAWMVDESRQETP